MTDKQMDEEIENRGVYADCLQDEAPEFLEDADALLERQTLEHLIGAVQGCYSPLAKRRPKVVEDEGL